MCHSVICRDRCVDQIDEKVKEAIMRDLVRYAPGIEIIGVRVTKPKIPPTIARNYEQMEEERTKVKGRGVSASQQGWKDGDHLTAYDDTFLYFRQTVLSLLTSTSSFVMSLSTMAVVHMGT